MTRTAFSIYKTVNAVLVGAISAVIWLAGLFAPATVLSRVDQPSFCDGVVVRDYLKPLEGLPDLHRPPEGLRLPFGPRQVQLLQIDSLVVGAGEIGFSLAYRTFPRRLNWEVTATMTRISAHGSAFGKAKTKRVVVGRPRNEAFDDLFFSVSAAPALYRINIVFRNRSGKRLGAYGQYFRVVSPLQDARLRLSATSYRAGEVVQARVENFGTELVTYGVPYSIERYNGASWEEAPESPKGPWILPLLFSQPGMSGRCFEFTLPAETASGRYRFVKPADYAGISRSSPRRGTPIILTAEFDIAP